MRFRSYDTQLHRDCTTEITRAGIDVIETFLRTWVPSCTSRFLQNPLLSYTLFRWHRYIKFSLMVDSTYRCYAAHTGNRLDGLICLKVDDEVKVAFLSTAPWNYGKTGRMRRIGSGLLTFVIKTSIFAGQEGTFRTYAVPDAESFYEMIGMTATGDTSEDDLKEYEMEKGDAYLLRKEFEQYIVWSRRVK